ncbi:MAG TPA: hypothetical protein VFL36_13000 [Myxococcales bacterium]|nr:hypothetical protein [Myxococcales bacterium]
MEATPWWIHAFWVAASGLYFLSGWQLLRDRATAFPAFAAACVIGPVGNLLSQSVPGYGAR